MQNLPHFSRKATNGNFVLGNDRFKEEISKTLVGRMGKEWGTDHY